MPDYKLMYFNLPGRGELIRLIFSAAKVEFDDHRVAREDWPKVKQEMPFNAMPVLYIDGTPLCESGAIQRYLASEFGLNGANNLQAAYIEMANGLISDCYSKMPFFEKDPEKKKQKIADAHNNHILPTLLKIEKKFADSKRQFLVGDKLSYADLKLTNNLIWSEKDFPEILSKIPALHALSKRVRNLEGIKQYLANRPQ